MKAQGLPINFIVIAALAILILILAAGFVIAGGGAFTRAMGPQQAKQACDAACSDLNLYTQNNVETATGFKEPHKFCELNMSIKGVGYKTCPEITTCILMFEDGSTCRAKCSDGNVTC